MNICNTQLESKLRINKLCYNKNRELVDLQLGVNASDIHVMKPVLLLVDIL